MSHHGDGVSQGGIKDVLDALESTVDVRGHRPCHNTILATTVEAEEHVDTATEEDAVDAVGEVKDVADMVGELTAVIDSSPLSL